MKLDLNEDIKVDFKMSILNTKLYSWLFSAWLHLSSKQEIVKKGWYKYGLLPSFHFHFQKNS
jgi:hypothetical protein